MNDLVVAMTTGASSSTGVRLVELLISGPGKTVHLLISPAATEVIERKLGVWVKLDHFDPTILFHSDSSERLKQF